jgi:hypothetical protein
MGENEVNVLYYWNRIPKREKKGQALWFILSTNIYTYTKCFFSGEAEK